MQPEISRRCPSCGAAIRQAGAMFCPECGQPLSQDAQRSSLAESGGAATGDFERREPTRDNASPADGKIERPAPAPASQNPVAAHPHRIAGKTRETLHRASAAARGVIVDEVKRVEKIRHVSTTVIEEASYDPSLRFVLVALGLFIVFVILLIASKVMG